MLIFLTGFMGSGKTTVGKKLAGRLAYKFVDLDEWAAKESGMQIPAIFEQKGEAFFRKLESDLLKKLHSHTNTVIATGGGTPCFHDNMAWMKKHGITVYFQLSAGSLYHRLARSKNIRPLLHRLNDVNLMEYIIEKLEERVGYYSMADLVIKGEDLNIEELLKKLEPMMKRNSQLR